MLSPRLIAALGLLALLGACQDGAALSKDDYVERAGEICTDAFADAKDRFEEEAPDTDLSDPEFGEEVAAGFHLLYEIEVETYTEIRDELASLSIPAGDDEAITAMNEALERGLDVARRRLEALESEDFETHDELANEQIGAEFSMQAAAYGIEGCSLEAVTDIYEPGSEA